jgi:hypothetical protein
MGQGSERPKGNEQRAISYLYSHRVIYLKRLASYSVSSEFTHARLAEQSAQTLFLVQRNSAPFRFTEENDGTHGRRELRARYLMLLVALKRVKLAFWFVA